MIAVIDSGGANIASVQFALQRLGASSILTRDINQIRSADRVILPGVGAAPIAMQSLGTAELIEPIRQLRQPVLGICLGMQLLFRRSSEGNTHLLDIISGDCIAFRVAKGRSVPHMGWNSIRCKGTHPLLTGLPDLPFMYFVHSYFIPVGVSTIAACTYGDDFTAVVAKENFMGCQFHPERSGELGARILQNFLEMPS